MKLHITLFFVVISMISDAQDFYEHSGNTIILNNGFILKKIEVSEDHLFSSELKIPESGENFILKSKEFSIKIDGQEYDGLSGWRLNKIVPISDSAEGRGIKLLLEIKNGSILLSLNYLLYPKSPIIRKWIEATNVSEKEIKLEEINVEDLQTSLSHVHSMVYHDYGRMKHIGKFIGEWDDPVVVIHNFPGRKGIALGNEAPGILKRTTYHTTYNNIEIGLTHLDDDFPFRKWLKPGDTWESPKTFIGVYENRNNGYTFIDDGVNEFVVRYMRPKIVELENKPTFVYNTWNPFRTFINDTLIQEVASAAAECGIQEFIVDDGWQVNVGGKTSTKGWGNLIFSF